MKQIFALLSGLLFGLGLIVSGMADPAKVLNFLDLFLVLISNLLLLDIFGPIPCVIFLRGRSS